MNTGPNLKIINEFKHHDVKVIIYRITGSAMSTNPEETDGYRYKVRVYDSSYLFGWDHPQIGPIEFVKETQVLVLPKIYEQAHTIIEEHQLKSGEQSACFHGYDKDQTANLPEDYQLIAEIEDPLAAIARVFRNDRDTSRVRYYVHIGDSEPSPSLKGHMKDLDASNLLQASHLAGLAYEVIRQSKLK